MCSAKGVEARAGLHCVEHVVANDNGLRVVSVPLFKQRTHGSLLSLGADVDKATLCVMPAFVADANGVMVVVLAMCANHLNWMTYFDSSDAANHIVITATVL